MNTGKLILIIFQYIIQGSAAILIPVVIHFILTKISKAKLEKVILISNIVVNGVEQFIGNGNGEEKKVIAEQRLSKLTKGKLSVELIDTLIENSVAVLNKEVKTKLEKN